MPRHRRAAVRRPLAAGLPLLFLNVMLPAAAVAYQDPPSWREPGYGPSFGFVTDGSTVMNAGEMHLHVTNWGLIGSAPNLGASHSDAPSCQWPAGSGEEYLFLGALWVGGKVLGERVVSTGGLASEWLPRDELEATVYEAVDGQIVRPLGNPEAGGARAPMPDPDDDGDGLIDEETLNGHDDDGDGLIDEDFGQVGTQMMVATMYDNTRLAQERFPDHTPMNLELVQRTFAWENDAADDFVGFDYTITNVGVVDVEQVYIGFFADGDVGPRDVDGYYEDDLAGSWRGMVRASDGTWVPVEVGYMFDAASPPLVHGYFGIMFLDHDVDPTGRRAPTRVGLRTFQAFAGNQAFEQGGDPTNDDQAYQLLAAPADEWDSDPKRPGDFRILVSAGPFARVAPDVPLSFRVALVCGPGLGTARGGQGLLANCAEAWLTYQGVYVDRIDRVVTEEDTVLDPGRGGRETMLCEDDFPGVSDPFANFRPDFMDTSCLDPLWLLDKPGVRDEDLFRWQDRTCAMFNLDNCFECARRAGRPCGPDDFEPGGAWTCNDTTSLDLAGCTGIEGLETQITWLVGMAPPPPGLRLWPTDGRVHVFWDDRSEHALDVRLQQVDFESYRVWRADHWTRPVGSSVENGPEGHLWQLQAEFDVVNHWLRERPDAGGGTVRDTIPLGANTGLERIVYRPRVLDDPRYAGLAEAMQRVVDGDPEGRLRARPPLRGPDGRTLPAYRELLPWETEPAVLDTFFAVAARPPGPGVTVSKRATRYYEYVDRGIHNGFLYFYAVTATDHDLPVDRDDPDPDTPRGPGLAGDPGSSFRTAVPGTEAQTAAARAREGANVYVYPNPATREALAAYQPFEPSGDDPTGVRVTFTNLPAAHNRLRIYTAAGDLVREIDHDGTGGAGHVSWNLMSRNGQEIVSGIYLFSVQSDDPRFDDVVGKFVVVR